MNLCRGTVLLLFVLLLQSGCCTKELALSLGDAARESFFREQDRLQQRFLQIEADAIKDTVATVQNVITDEKTKAAARQLAEEFTSAADRGMKRSNKRLEESLTTLDKQLNKSVVELSAQLQQEQTKISETTVKTMEKVSSEVGKNLRIAMTESIRETRKAFTEEEIINEAAKNQIKRTIQPLINEIIEESGRKAGETMQQTIDDLSYPLATGSAAMLVIALLTMVLPSMFLFMSYKRSIAAINAMKEVLDAQRELIE
ncbi:MAG: hypothetical protein P1V97_09450, partial [Planctomycetota bacterium]|nr:hypothetical protein [Planctomycetota bacterium]